MRAEADGKNIDNLRKATGADHNEKMEQMKAQAEGNQDLEITKALLKDHKPEDKPGSVEAAVGYNRLSKAMHEMSKYWNPTLDRRVNNNYNI